MSIKNKDLKNLIEKYNEIFSNVLVVESSGGNIVANQVSKEINNLNTDEDETPSVKGNVIAPIDTPEEELPDDMLDAVSTPGYIPRAVPKYKATNLSSWSYKTLHLAINHAFAQKQPLLILGDPGIGKSDTVRAFSEQIASSTTKGKYLKEDDFDFSTDPSKNQTDASMVDSSTASGPREYIDWAEIDLDKKKEVLREPWNYFVVLELTATELDRLDIKGIPVPKTAQKDTEFSYTEYEKSLELYLCTRKGIEGIIFLDEVNLGTIDVKSALLKFVQKRTVADDKISPGFAIIAASNIPGTGGVDSDTLSTAFLGRQTGGIGVLVADPDQWCEWAESVGIDERIIAFIKENPEDYFYTTEDLETLRAEQRPFTAPRSLVAFSKVYSKALKDFYRAIKAGRTPRIKFEDYVMERGEKIVGEKWIKGFLSWVDEVRGMEIQGILSRGDLGRKQPGSVKTADVGKIIYFIKTKLKTAISNLLRKGIKLEDSSQMSEQELEQFFETNINRNPEVFKYFEGCAMIIARVKAEWSGILLRGLKRDLTEDQRRIFMEFLEFGNYDPKTKKEILDEVLPELDEFIG
jgi:DNA polymerase III delta prime subunit